MNGGPRRDELLPFLGHLRIRVRNRAVADHDRKPSTPIAVDSRSIATIYGNDAVGEMTDLRARWRRWEGRKIAQRALGGKKIAA